MEVKAQVLMISAFLQMQESLFTPRYGFEKTILFNFQLDFVILILFSILLKTKFRS